MQLLRLTLLVIATCTLLLSSTGLRISQHWCGDELVSVNIWGDAEPCGHATKSVSCPIHGTMMVSDNNCCDQREFKIEASEEEFLNHAYCLEFDNLGVDLPNIETKIAGAEYSGETPQLTSHSPPLIGTPIIKLTQHFLI